MALFIIDPTALDPYIYPDSPSVLKNRFGIKSKATLDQIENDISAGKILEFLQDPRAIIGDTTGLEALQKIHSHLFSDIYEWAGDLRESAIAKREPLLDGRSVSYPPPTSIIDDDVLMGDMISSALNLSSADTEPSALPAENITIDALALLVKRLWVAHPFREGNTRAISLYAIHLANESGLTFMGDLNAPDHSFRDLLVLAYKGADDPLKSQMKSSFQLLAPKPSNTGVDQIMGFLSNSDGVINKIALESLQKTSSAPPERHEEPLSFSR